MPTRRYVKHTKESLEPIVRDSTSYRQVLAKLGLRYAGGSYKNLKNRITEYNIDTSHFLGRGHNKGQKSQRRRTPDQVLVLGTFGDAKVKAPILRRALAEIGRESVCAECGVKDVYNGKPIVLQIDHINGNNWDNRSDNLRFLCPNCHSQTETFGNKNARVGELLDPQR